MLWYFSPKYSTLGIFSKCDIKIRRDALLLSAMRHGSSYNEKGELEFWFCNSFKAKKIFRKYIWTVCTRTSAIYFNSWMKDSNSNGRGVLVHPVLREKGKIQNICSCTTQLHMIGSYYSPNWPNPISWYFSSPLWNSHNNDPFGPISVPLPVPHITWVRPFWGKTNVSICLQAH